MDQWKRSLNVKTGKWVGIVILAARAVREVWLCLALEAYVWVVVQDRQLLKLGVPDHGHSHDHGHGRQEAVIRPCRLTCREGLRGASFSRPTPLITNTLVDQYVTTSLIWSQLRTRHPCRGSCFTISVPSINAGNDVDDSEPDQGVGSAVGGGETK